MWGRLSGAADRRSQLVAVAAWLAVLAVGVVALVDQAPPAPANSGRPDDFQTQLAMGHLEAIAVEPHSMTQADHSRVRDHFVRTLLDLGYETDVHAFTVDASFTSYNVLGRLAGTDSTGAVMLSGHYDSVPNAPGAADDGIAVGAMIEAARALAEGEPLRNDVVFFFTDGEESGLVGARAFARDHPWRDEVGFVLNFEAGGPRGPLMLIEDHLADPGMIRSYRSSSPSPFSSSLMPTLIQAAAEANIGTSDFVPLKDLGEPGLNFSSGVDTGFRHTPGDEFHRVDPKTVEHQGQTMLALAREFGNQDLREVGSDTGDVVWLGLVTAFMPVWSSTMALLLLGLLFVLFALFVVRARQTGARLPVMLGAAGAGLGTAVLAPLAITGIIGLMQVVRPSYRPHFAGLSPRDRLPGAGLPNSELLWWAMVFVAVAVTALLLGRLRRRLRAEELLGGSLGLFVALAALTTISVPGVSFLFVVPALATAASGLLWQRASTDEATSPWLLLGVVLLGALPVVLVAVHLGGTLFTMTVANGAILAPFIALFSALLVLLFEVLGQADRRLPVLLPGAFALLGLVIGLVAVSPDPITDTDTYEGPRATTVTASEPLAAMDTGPWRVEQVELNRERHCLEAQKGQGTTRYWCRLPDEVAVDLDLQQARTDDDVLLFGGVAQTVASVRVVHDSGTVEVEPHDTGGPAGRVFAVALPTGTERVVEVLALDDAGSAVQTWAGFEVIDA